MCSTLSSNRCDERRESISDGKSLKPTSFSHGIILCVCLSVKLFILTRNRREAMVGSMVMFKARIARGQLSRLLSLAPRDLRVKTV